MTEEANGRLGVAGHVLDGGLSQHLRRYVKLRRRAAISADVLFTTTKGTPYVVRALRFSPMK